MRLVKITDPISPLNWTEGNPAILRGLPTWNSTHIAFSIGQGLSVRKTEPSCSHICLDAHIDVFCTIVTPDLTTSKQRVIFKSGCSKGFIRTLHVSIYECKELSFFSKLDVYRGKGNSHFKTPAWPASLYIGVERSDKCFSIFDTWLWSEAIHVQNAKWMIKLSEAVQNRCLSAHLI